jgi:hypothetical protein
MAIIDGPTSQKITADGYITSTVTLHTDGRLFVDAYLKNNARRHGMRARVAVACLDDRGRAHWVSSIYAFPTMCGTWDPTCPSEKQVEPKMEKLPDPVGELTRSLDVHRWDGESGVDWHTKLIRQIQDAQEVYDEIKPYLDTLGVLISK